MIRGGREPTEMSSFRHPRVFDPLDLEIIDRVCEAAWAQLEARQPFRDREQDEERREALCKLVMDRTGTDRIKFDTLCKRCWRICPKRG
jgi:hypothetical protein